MPKFVSILVAVVLERIPRVPTGEHPPAHRCASSDAWGISAISVSQIGTRQWTELRVSREIPATTDPPPDLTVRAVETYGGLGDVSVCAKMAERNGV